jgi:predicted TIM-barrel fold metal-dependent hydrolase
LKAIGSGRARWANGEEFILLPKGYGERAFTYQTLAHELEQNDVSKAILLQGDYYGFCNDYIAEAQTVLPDRFLGMGTLDPYCRESLSIIRHLLDDYNFRGLKFEISSSYGLMGYHPDFKLDSKVMRPVWEEANQRGIVISLDLGTFGEPSLQIEAVKRLSSHYENTTIIIEHLFAPGHDHFDDVAQKLDSLGKCENVYFTTAALPANTKPDEYPFPIAARYIKIARDTVGINRILFGSDLPSVAVDTPYSQLISYIADNDLFSEQELIAIYAANAQKVYKIG